MYRPNLTLDEAAAMIGKEFHIPHTLTGHEVEHRMIDGRNWTSHVYPKTPATKRMVVTAIGISKYSEGKIMFHIEDVENKFNHRMQVAVDELYEQSGDAQHVSERRCAEALQPKTEN